jgi:hypothetical protein
VKFETWTADDWVRHYAGPRWSGRSEPGSAWDEHGRRVPGETVRYASGLAVVTPDDVRQAKKRLDVRYRSVTADVEDCKGMGDDERRSFHEQLHAWRTFYCGSVADCVEPHVEVFGLGAQMDQIEHYDQQLYDWQHRIAQHCHSAQPGVRPETEEERAAKRMKPALILGAIAGALFFIGPSVRRELFGPVMIRKDLVAARRQRAHDMGDADVAINTEGKALGSDLAAKVSDALQLTAHAAGRAVGTIGSAIESVGHKAKELAEHAAEKSGEQ